MHGDREGRVQPRPLTDAHLPFLQRHNALQTHQIARQQRRQLGLQRGQALKRLGGYKVRMQGMRMHGWANR